MPLDKRGWTGWEPPFPPRQVQLIIESLPAETSVPEATSAIARRTEPRHWHGSRPQLAGRTALPIAALDDRSTQYQVHIGVQLRPGADPATVRDQLATIYGITLEEEWAFPAPLASMMRSWVGHHRGEDIQASLNRLADAIRRDRRRELRNR